MKTEKQSIYVSANLKINERFLSLPPLHYVEMSHLKLAPKGDDARGHKTQNDFVYSINFFNPPL